MIFCWYYVMRFSTWLSYLKRYVICLAKRINRHYFSSFDYDIFALLSSLFKLYSETTVLLPFGGCHIWVMKTLLNCTKVRKVFALLRISLFMAIVFNVISYGLGFWLCVFHQSKSYAVCYFCLTFWDVECLAYASKLGWCMTILW